MLTLIVSSPADGLNEVTATLMLQVLYVTESMLFNSITIRLSEMTQEAFLSHLLEYFTDALSAIIPCPKENIYVFSIMVIFVGLNYVHLISFWGHIMIKFIQ